MRNIMGTFTCAANDSWDWVSVIFYGSEKYAPDLMSANPEHSGICVFDGGETIYIPEIPETAANRETVLANTEAPWKE